MIRASSRIHISLFSRWTNHGYYFPITLYVRLFIRAHFYLLRVFISCAHRVGPRVQDSCIYVRLYTGDGNEPGC